MRNVRGVWRVRLSRCSSHVMTIVGGMGRIQLRSESSSSSSFLQTLQGTIIQVLICTKNSAFQALVTPYPAPALFPKVANVVSSTALWFCHVVLDVGYGFYAVECLFITCSFFFHRHIQASDFVICKFLVYALTKFFASLVKRDMGWVSCGFVQCRL